LLALESPAPELARLARDSLYAAEPSFEDLNNTSSSSCPASMNAAGLYELMTQSLAAAATSTAGLQT